LLGQTKLLTSAREPVIIDKLKADH